MANWCKLYKNLIDLWFYAFFFIISYMYIAPGQITPGEQF